MAFELAAPSEPDGDLAAHFDRFEGRLVSYLPLKPDDREATRHTLRGIEASCGRLATLDYDFRDAATARPVAQFDILADISHNGTEPGEPIVLTPRGLLVQIWPGQPGQDLVADSHDPKLVLPTAKGEDGKLLVVRGHLGIGHGHWLEWLNKGKKAEADGRHYEVYEARAWDQNGAHIRRESKPPTSSYTFNTPWHDLTTRTVELRRSPPYSSPPAAFGGQENKGPVTTEEFTPVTTQILAFGAPAIKACANWVADRIDQGPASESSASAELVGPMTIHLLKKAQALAPQPIT